MRNFQQRVSLLFCCIYVSFSLSYASSTGVPVYQVDAKILNWMRSNVSPQTNLPLSFHIREISKNNIYQNMGEADRVEDIIERVIVEEGLIVYDGAVGQIVLGMSGNKKDLELSQVPIDVYWNGGLGQLASIRAGYVDNSFIYDPEHPEKVSANLDDKGHRGFIYRIINANGRYNTKDPLDGKTHFKGFPQYDTVHWEDWKPVAGENAWVVMAAMHLYHNKHYDQYLNMYDHNKDATELKLAKELARAAIILQAENGGIRMAPIGAYRNPRDCPDNPELCINGEWWYNQISSENNISWYGAFRMLYQVTGEHQYKIAMEGVENYFRQVWNEEGEYFEQGMNFSDGEWRRNNDHFALDVQTWGVSCFGPEKIEEWFGEGSVYRMWQKAKSVSGAYGAGGELIGVGYTNEHDRVSVEWTAGAIMAAWDMKNFYANTRPEWAEDISKDMNSMRQGVESLRFTIDSNREAYSYSSRRGWIPFGWNSHDPEVLSLASTGWMVFVDNQFNPFYLDGRVFKNQFSMLAMEY